MTRLRSSASGEPSTTSAIADDDAVERATLPARTSQVFASPRPAQNHDPLVGTLLDGRYRIERRIGTGGMGVVYLAEHLLIRRKVAIKMLQASAFADEDAIERFRREAQAAVAAGSEHVVGVTDMGRLPDATHYLVLEYLEGVELAVVVAMDGQLAIARAIDIIVQLCDALTAVHAAGIVHRDLKPENVFLIERDGRPDFVKVLDFGVCKMLDGDGSDRRLTASGAALGTPHFMAPEQVEGRADVDHRADIYAVGAILFFLLSGSEPIDAPSLPRLFMRICEDLPPLLCTLRPEVPEALAQVVARALSKRPEARYPSCVELKAALLPFAAWNDAQAGPSGAAARPVATRAAAVHGDSQRMRVPGRRVWPARVLLALLTLAAFGMARWMHSTASQREPVPAQARAVRDGNQAPRAAAAVQAAGTQSAAHAEAIAPVLADPAAAAAPSHRPRVRAGAVGARERSSPEPEPKPDALEPELVPAAPIESPPPAAADPAPAAPRTIKHVF